MATEKNQNPEKVLSIEWLQKNKYKIVLPGVRAFRIRVAGILYHQLTNRSNADRIRAIHSVLHSITKRSLQRYLKDSFEFTANVMDIAGAATDDLKSFYNDEFEVMIRDHKGKITAGFVCTLDRLTQMDYSENTNILDLDKVAEYRKKEMNRSIRIEDRTDKDIEDITRQICERFACGMFTIVECCDFFGIEYMDFLKWVYVNDMVRQLFMEANSLALFSNQSRQMTLVDVSLIAALHRGFTETTEIIYKKKPTPQHPEGIFVEIGKKVIRKDHSVGEMAQLRALFVRAVLTEGMPQADDIEGWSDEKLAQYTREQISKNSDALRLRDMDGE